METWYNKYPERWAQEQQALQEAHINFQINTALEAKGILQLKLAISEQSKITVPLKFLPLSLAVNFPTNYPYFRPEVYAPELNLPRHQHVLHKNLCLLNRATNNWLPETTLADFLIDQIPKVLAEGEITDPHILESIQGEQAEPVSEYYRSVLNASVTFNPEPFDSMPFGQMTVELLGTMRVGIPPTGSVPTRMTVLESFDIDQQLLDRLPEGVAESFPPRLTGGVYRLNERPPNVEVMKDFKWFLGLLDNQNEKLLKPKNPVVLKDGYKIENVIALTFPEEHLPGKQASGWLFVIIYIMPVRKIINKKIVSVNEKYYYYAKANRINNAELSFRISSLKPLVNKKVTVFGLGALGGPSVLEFARNGVKELKIVDNDIVNAGTTVRWPLGVAYAGMYKADALKEHIYSNYPFTEVRPYVYKVGGEDTPDQQKLQEILADTSLIYDATAEIGVNHFLSLEAQQRKIPYVCVYGTPGVWGGVCLRIVPGITEGCWMCFQYSLVDGTIPVPPLNRDGDIQAAGCGDISFMGASFELANIVNSGVRQVVGILCSGEGGGYHDLNADVGILSLVDDFGNPKFPSWLSYQLKKHPQCPYCNTKTK
ncbi:ThiF family adenylyltransferase [Mucilaginibacter aquatilis]|uniref:THIF-type NAD/FAD binding fold domain-containing protein n=1 Tax=Mucilaginibacter aquatilis TaxID=1517760 RepID=A0A6I4I5Q0_9SPHI|nr:ThiF family adenylyltransferase [Mucilaginibacter aquatilis]MVN90525.1 hypothetical protein [Mucilaginibacter aquatilis]